MKRFVTEFRSLMSLYDSSDQFWSFSYIWVFIYGLIYRILYIAVVQQSFRIGH